MKINNVLLAFYIGLRLVEILFGSSRFNYRKVMLRGAPVFAFFVLAVIASFHSLDWENIYYLETQLSLLLVPIALISEDDFDAGKRRKVFMALVFGCLTTLAICYANLIWEILSKGESWANWFTWSNMGHDFTPVADTHPTYLGLFIVTSILFLIQDELLSKKWKYFFLIVFVFGLFQLASDMVVLLLLLFFVYLAISKVSIYKQQIMVLVSGIGICALLFWTMGDKYMNNRMFSVDSILDEKRIERWEVSYEIFKENPFIGVGFAEIDSVRRQKYIDGNYSLAEANDLNAHNQFLEYLSINGAIGGFAYVLSLGLLFLLSVYRKDYLFTFIFFAFILANLTESTLVRIKGIEYFAIFSSLFLSWPGKAKK
ncbi:O-antigen ligase family protein [Flagellimonas myxillae]|uniref:O-antigen ligase family protein n=1 Tax=Flagellimonas myxillae TaxID=2942214 RepID=UPI00201E802D|nr:O-antigen ligase family protein [Muricauda myxillae]MCL6266673.1 O-antigen ligase family protein [Muricauda myxillae]